MSVIPIIHCQVEREPTSFHASDVAEETFTFSVNLALEVRAEKEEDLEQDEIDAEALYRAFYASLADVKFWLFQFNDPGEPLAFRMQLPQVSEPFFDPNAFCDWLASRRSQAVSASGKRYRFWTTLGDASVSDASDETRTTAFISSRTVASWDAPVGHEIGVTHLVRLPAHSDGNIVVLPALVEPDPRPVYVSSTGDTYDFAYKLGIGDLSVEARTEVFDPWTNPSDKPDPIASTTTGGDRVEDPDVDENGFLKLNSYAEELSRYLGNFEGRATTLPAATSGLLPGETVVVSIGPLNAGGDTINGIDALEKLIGLSQANWGAAVWYATARLVGALDPWVIALMQPGDGGHDVAGDVLANLIIAILDALDEARAAGEDVPDPEPKQLVEKIRFVLTNRCALVAGGPADLLSRSLQHIFGITPAIQATNEKKQSVIAPDQPVSALVPLLLDGYHGDANGVPPAHVVEFLKKIVGHTAETLTVALSELEQQLHDEAGAERALIRLFEVAEFGAERFPVQLATALDGTPSAALVEAIETGWAKYRAILDGPFNGDEAVRRAAAGTVTRELLKGAIATVSVDDLTARVRQADYHARRFGFGDYATHPDGELGFDSIANVLVKPAGRPTRPDFAQRLREAYLDAAPATEPPSNGRFIPDPAPKPLALQIASGIEADKLDVFARSFNGICVAVRRLDAPDQPWSYANLADLSWRKGGEENGVLHPNLPGVTNGRGTMFLAYEGVPFAGRPAPEALKHSGMQPIAAERFYDYGPHDFTAKDFAKAPRLAYGRWFESFSFVATNAGTIPRGLQLSDGRPWMPAKAIEQLIDGKDEAGDPWAQPVVLPYPSSRRTAIAQMSSIESRASGRPGRIGAGLKNVYPLSKDYPRLGILSSDKLPGTLDLFRDSDGVGRMSFPAYISSGLHWTLDEIECSAETGPLEIRIFDRPPSDPDDTGIATLPIKQGVAAYSRLELYLEDTPKPPAAPATVLPIRSLKLFAVDADGRRRELLARRIPFGEKLCWMRLILVDEGAGPVSLSFVDPDGHRRAGQAAPLLLFAPDSDEPWPEGFSDPVEQTVRTPRVSYEDFRRWMATEELAKEAYGAEKAKWERLIELLSFASSMRHLDKRLGALLDTLPDPAVRFVVLELQATDSLTKIPAPPIPEEYRVPWLHQSFASLNLAMSDPPIVDHEDNDDEDEKEEARWIEDLITGVLEPLDRYFSFKLTLQPGADLRLSSTGGSAFVAANPAGCIALYSASALVPLMYFKAQGKHPPVIDTRLLQFATRSMAGYAAFDAGAIKIETMYDGMGSLTKGDNEVAIELVSAMISARPVPDTRRYDIVAASTIDAPLRNYWRLIAEIEVTTQRWRPTGKPIYQYIRPRDYTIETATAGLHPALSLNPLSKLDTEAHRKIDRFEREAYFDRSDADAHTPPAQRLEPLPASTVLQEFPWDGGGATYFRHRFTLRSRYADALSARRAASAWRSLPENLPTRAHSWTMRVAMLAELSRQTLTQPQLRGLIPLTVAPSGDERRQVAPPVAVILQEPPFARGGLADRVTAEIRTGFGYGFEKGANPVKILDSRKEAGPNPHKDYRPLPAERALALALRCEGPMGLTFDAEAGSAPALANSMMLVRPFALDNVDDPLDLQEAEIGVATRRYIDPHWLTGVSRHLSDGEQARIEPLNRSWWIEIGAGDAELAYQLETGKPVEILRISRKGSLVSVWVKKGPIDGGIGANDNAIEIGRFDLSKGGSPKILHQQITPGNFVVSVLVDTGSGLTDEGETNVPVVLSSFSWSLPKETSASPDQEAPEAASAQLICSITGSEATIWETMASDSTAVRWIEVSRNFDYLNRLEEGDDRRQQASSLRAELLNAEIENNGVSFHTVGNKIATRLCSSTIGNPYGIELHRHLAVVSSSFVKELGRPVERFGRAAIVVGPPIRFAAATKTAEHAVRLIEFSTPASILCASGVPAPPKYRSAYFDLIETGYVKGQALLLTMRFVGTGVHLKVFDSVSLRLSQPGQPDAAVISHPLRKNRCPILLHALIEGNKVRSWVVYNDGAGDVVPSVSKLVLDPELVPGFHASISAETRGVAEFWSDVSLLHGPMDSTEVKGSIGIRFDFNWLFSPEAKGDPALLVSARGLSDQAGAQSRIVAVSPPIPVLVD